jgi:F-type H+-transporting ATPase subunit b
MLSRESASAALLVVLSGIAAASSEATEAAHGTEPGIFDGSLADAIWATAAFGVLLVVLARFAWKPLLAALKNREEHISKQISDAEATRRNAERFLDENKQKGQELLKRVAEEAQKMEREIIEKAKEEAAMMKQKAQSDIEHARAAAAEQMWQEAGQMLMSVGSEVIGRMVTADDERRLIGEAVDKLRQEKAGQPR